MSRPGNTKIPRGADQNVTAKLLGFSSVEATLMVRTDPAGSSSACRSCRRRCRQLRGHAVPCREVDGVLRRVERRPLADVHDGRSSICRPSTSSRSSTTSPPTPASSRARSIRAATSPRIKGTDVRLKITPTMATPGGRVMLNENDSLPLTKQADGTLAGNFTVNEQGFYRIELEGPHGEKVNASPQYTIDVLTDMAPSVRFNKPGRDTQRQPGRRSLRRGEGRRRLRREAGADVLLGERRRREDDARCSAARRRCPR